MSIPIAAVMPVPIVDAARGANHQRVRAEATSIEIPSFFVVNPVAVVIQGGTLGTAYSETISAQGGTAPYSYALTSGSLPTGLTLNSSTGVISGTPAGTGTSTFTITVTDANMFTGPQIFTIVVAPASGANNFGWVG